MIHAHTTCYSVPSPCCCSFFIESQKTKRPTHFSKGSIPLCAYFAMLCFVFHRTVFCRRLRHHCCCCLCCSYLWPFPPQFIVVNNNKNILYKYILNDLANSARFSFCPIIMVCLDSVHRLCMVAFGLCFWFPLNFIAVCVCLAIHIKPVDCDRIFTGISWCCCCVGSAIGVRLLKS